MFVMIIDCFAWLAWTVIYTAIYLALRDFDILLSIETYEP